MSKECIHFFGPLCIYIVRLQSSAEVKERVELDLYSPYSLRGLF